MVTERVDLSTVTDVTASSGTVTLTESGARALKFTLDASSAHRAVRVHVEPGGCMGWRYTVAVAAPSSIEPSDVAVESNGVTVLVDAAALPHLRGAVIDFTQEGFSVRNPNSRGSCSCGASFADNVD